MSQISLDHWFDMQPFDAHGAFALFALDEFGYRMQGGLQQLPWALEQQLAQPVRTGHTLTELRSADGNQYVLDFQAPKGERLRVFADVVMLTIPATPLQRDLVLDLPVQTGDAIRQVSDQPMGHNVKTIALFRKPFWRSRVPNAFFYLSAADFVLWEAATATPAPSLYALVVYSGGDLAAPAPEPAALIERVLAHLEPAFPSIRQDFVTVAQRVDWSSCPYTQGSYTGAGAEGVDSVYLHHPQGPLGHGSLTLAGEALSGAFRGFAEGAVATGLQAAERVLANHPSIATRGHDVDLKLGHHGLRSSG